MIHLRLVRWSRRPAGASGVAALALILAGCLERTHPIGAGPEPDGGPPPGSGGAGGGGPTGGGGGAGGGSGGAGGGGSGGAGGAPSAAPGTPGTRPLYRLTLPEY